MKLNSKRLKLNVVDNSEVQKFFDEVKGAVSDWNVQHLEEDCRLEISLENVDFKYSNEQCIWFGIPGEGKVTDIRMTFLKINFDHAKKVFIASNKLSPNLTPEEGMSPSKFVEILAAFNP